MIHMTVIFYPSILPKVQKYLYLLVTSNERPTIYSKELSLESKKRP